MTLPPTDSDGVFRVPRSESPYDYHWKTAPSAVSDRAAIRGKHMVKLKQEGPTDIVEEPMNNSFEPDQTGAADTEDDCSRNKKNER